MRLPGTKAAGGEWRTVVKLGEARYYLGVSVTEIDSCGNGWAWATWPDGRRFRFWLDQLKATPWGDA